jgi:hypothetical protein
LFSLAKTRAQSLSTVKHGVCKPAEYEHNIQIYTDKITNSSNPYKKHYPKIDKKKPNSSLGGGTAF